MNPALLAYLAQLTGAVPPQQQQQQGQSQFPVVNGVDPLAPLPQEAPDQAQAPIAPPPPDSMNDGINSVGRPSDISAGDADSKNKLDADYQKRYKQMLREGKGQALLALGAQLLSSRTFGEGLSKGLLAYQQTLSKAKDDLKPKHNPIGGGAFDQVVDPVTGEATYEETPVAQFEKDKVAALTDRAYGVQDLRNQGSQAVAETNTGSREKIANLQWSTRKDIANLQANTAKYGADLRAQTAKDVAEINAQHSGKGNTRATASLINTIVAQQQGLNQTTIAMQNLAPILQDLKTGSLTLSLGKNAMRKLSMATGVGGSDPETLKYARMRQVVEQNRNAILMAAKGVQTEGDAQRALSQIMSSDANTATVTAQFEFLMDILKRNAENTRNIITGIKNQTGVSLDAPASSSSSDVQSLKQKYGLE